MICRAVFVLTLASLGALLGGARVAGAQEQEAMLGSHNEYRMKHCTPAYAVVSAIRPIGCEMGARLLIFPFRIWITGSSS